MERLTLALIAVLVVAVSTLAFVVTGLDSRVDGLSRTEPDQPETREPDAASKDELARAVRRIDALEERMAEWKARGGVTAPLAEGSTPADASDGREGTAAAPGELERRLAELEKEVADADDPLDDKKPPLTALAKALDFTELQTEETAREIDEGKRETFELIDLPRADGGSLMDDLSKLLAEKEDPEDAFRAWFGKLFVEKVPGRDETYIAAIQKIETATWTRLELVLTPEQLKKMKRSDIEILEVKTGYEPFEERLGR